MSHRVPPPLAPGATLAVVAPASPFDRDELFRGLAWLSVRYRLRMSAGLLARDGYLAGDDARRAAELSAALTDPDVDGVVCARGGYGAMRILDALPWDAFAAHPKWLVGFSDVTALHLAAAAKGVCTIHGPNATGLGRSITAAERASVLGALEGRGSRERWDGLRVVHPGRARGIVCGGNLALVCAMASAGRFVAPAGAILALEDVTERPYRVDRMLTSLRLGGHFARASAIVFGGFTSCDPGPDGVTVDAVLAERTSGLGIPVVAGAPFGHGAPNRAFVLGAEASLEGGALAWDDQPSVR